MTRHEQADEERARRVPRPRPVHERRILFAIGVAIYARATRSRDRIGSIGFWSLIVFLIVAYIANITGPPPPDPRSLAVFALSGFLLPLWGWWVDRHRAPA